MTGRLRADASAGRQTFKYKQSSDGGFGAGAAPGGGPPNRPCIQSAGNSVAWRTPVHLAAGCGGRQRSSPTGGAANGTPLKETTPSTASPCSSPLSIFTREGDDCVRAV